MSRRPGTESAITLYTSDDEADWTLYLKSYDKAVHLVAHAKKKIDLIKLDKFLQDQLKNNIFGREPKHLELKELSDIMKWKLMRGKFRPLQKLVDSNDANLVQNSSEKAIEFILKNDWKAAIQSLIILKGVGVATATAILSFLAPQLCPFMADEVIEVVLNKRDYTMKSYVQIQCELTRKAEELNRLTKNKFWNAEDVGKALWTKAMLSSLPSTTDPDVSSEKKIEASVEPSILNKRKKEAKEIIKTTTTTKKNKKN
jgi:hypothetical protein